MLHLELSDGLKTMRKPLNTALEMLIRQKGVVHLVRDQQVLEALTKVEKRKRCVVL